MTPYLFLQIYFFLPNLQTGFLCYSVYTAWSGNRLNSKFSYLLCPRTNPTSPGHPLLPLKDPWVKGQGLWWKDEDNHRFIFSWRFLFKLKQRIYTLKVATVKVERPSALYVQSGECHWCFGTQKTQGCINISQISISESTGARHSIIFVKAGTGRTVVMSNLDQKGKKIEGSIHQGEGKEFMWELSGDSKYKRWQMIKEISFMPARCRGEGNYREEKPPRKDF